MKRYVLALVLMIVMLLVFTACRSNDIPVVLPIEQEPEWEIDDYPITEPIIESTDTYDHEQELEPYQYEDDNQEAAVAISEPVEISDFGRQAAEDFLRGFPTIFQTYTGWRNVETGSLYALDREIWDWVETDDMPIIYLGGMSDEYTPGFIFTTHFYDMDGNRLDDIMGFADSFSLFDLDEDGIPEVIVDFVAWGSSNFGFSMESVLFRFIDGAYREVGTFNRAHTFFKAPYGETILFIENLHDGIQGYYYLRLTDNGMVLESALPDSWWELEAYDWYQHHRWPYFFESPTPSMFITGTPLARISRLTGLEEEIAESIRQSLRQLNENSNRRSALPIFETRQTLSQGFTINNFLSDDWIGIWRIYHATAPVDLRAPQHVHINETVYRLGQVLEGWTGVPEAYYRWNERTLVLPTNDMYLLESGAYIVMIPVPDGYDDYFLLVID